MTVDGCPRDVRRWLPPFDSFLITCEHGGCRVPREYASLFRGRARLLASHRGWDPGALDLARAFARRLGAPLFAATTTRLLVELNRSPDHRALFSSVTRGLPGAVKERIFDDFYLPYRSKVAAAVLTAISSGRRLLHVSAHTFTPVLAGVTRRADVGLLYDPARPLERAFCQRLHRTLRERRPDLVIRRNYPYLGRADGFTTFLRRLTPPEAYAGVEIEVNQKHVLGPPRAWRALVGGMAAALREMVNVTP